MILAEFGKQSFKEQLLYYNSGGFLITVIYFNFAPERKQKAIIEAIREGRVPPRKLFTDPETNKIDWKMVLYIFLAAANQLLILSLICFNYRLCYHAGLNIGIAQAIWGINPFF